jgi:hypothetical protein
MGLAALEHPQRAVAMPHPLPPVPFVLVSILVCYHALACLQDGAL